MAQDSAAGVGGDARSKLKISPRRPRGNEGRPCAGRPALTDDAGGRNRGGVAVYTPVSDAQLSRFLARYDLGAPRAFKGIAEGVENSNFLLETDRGRYILTLYERRVRREELPFFLGLMRWAADRGFPCPLPQPDRQGALLGELNGRPAALVSFLPGLSATHPSVPQGRSAGEGCARLHLATAGFPGERANALGLAAWRPLWLPLRATAERLRPGLAAAIDADLDALERGWPRELPRGVIHADLFPDNVFFAGGGDRFAGAIDFYFACTDALAFDLAVMLNAWAFGPAGLHGDRARAVVEGYASARPLDTDERTALPLLARGAAMRFFLTRLADWEATPAGALVTRKDPLEYADKLAFWRSAASGSPGAGLDLGGAA